MKKNIKNLSLGAALLVALVACGKKSPDSPIVKPQLGSEQAGGIDSSGGDLFGMTFEQFQSKVSLLGEKKVPLIFKRLNMIRANTEDFRQMNLDISDTFKELSGKYNESDYQKIKISAQESSCAGDGHSTDGSASPSTNEICISYQAFKKMSDDPTTDRTMLALLIHEYSHLVGFDEAGAVAVQREFFSTTFDPIFSPDLIGLFENIRTFLMRSNFVAHDVLLGFHSDDLEICKDMLRPVQDFEGYSSAQKQFPELSDSLNAGIHNTYYNLNQYNTCEQKFNLAQQKEFYDKIFSYYERIKTVFDKLNEFYGSDCQNQKCYILSKNGV